jgi:hypothetical protein
MSDMYREIEASVGGRSRGLGVLGWLAVITVAFGVAGVGAMWVGFMAVRSEVEQVVEQVKAGPADEVGRMLSRLDPALEVVEPRSVGADVGAEAVALRDTRTGAVSTFDVQDLVEGHLRIRTDRGEATVDLRGGEDGGTLEIQGPEGEEFRAELVRNGDDARLVIRSEGEEVHLGAGAEAGPLPGWLPRVAGMPDSPRHIYSAHSSDGRLGAVGWSSDDPPDVVLEAVRDRLEDRGFHVFRQTVRNRSHETEISLWAEDEGSGRTAFVVASRARGATSVVLGYGEGS